jgi:phosphatase NudJ
MDDLQLNKTSIAGRYTPRVSVATIVCHDGKYLLVEEWIQSQLKLNQPAGHLEANESLIEAAARETLEETGCRVRITHLLCVDQLCASPLSAN